MSTIGHPLSDLANLLMPYTTALAVISAAAMAGVPLFNGFMSKEMFFSEALAAGGPAALPWLVPALATVGGVFSVSYSVRLIHQTASGYAGYFPP